jgi:hypothetical protein
MRSVGTANASGLDLAFRKMKDVVQNISNGQLTKRMQVDSPTLACPLRTDLGLKKTWFVQLNITNCQLTKGMQMDRKVLACALRTVWDRERPGSCS